MQCQCGRDVSSVPNILEKPLGRELPADAAFAGRFVDGSRNRVKLGALDIAALGIGDLSIGRPAFQSIVSVESRSR